MVIPVIDNSITDSNVIEYITTRIKRYENILNDKLNRCSLWMKIESNKMNRNPKKRADKYNCFYLTITYYFSYSKYNFINKEYIPVIYMITKDLAEIENYIKKNILNI